MGRINRKGSSFKQCREEEKEVKNMTESFIAQTLTHAIWRQLKSRFANTFKTAIFIDTHSIKAHIPYAAFIHIWKI